MPGVLLVLLLALGWWRRHTWGRPLFMLLICYVGLLGPVLGFVNIYFMRFSLVADHWQYAAMIVPCAVFAGLAATWSGRRRWTRLAAPVLGVALLALLAGMSYRQSRIYANMETLYKAVIAGNPDCWLAYGNLGQELEKQGRLDEAVASYKRALEIYPECVESRNNLGHLYARFGRLDEAITEYRKALAVKSDLAVIHKNLGAALAARYRLDEAIDEYRAARKIAPYDGEALLGLGAALVARGRFDEAIDECSAVLAIAPDFAEVHVLLGTRWPAGGGSTRPSTISRRRRN